jgi:hypothetical protein
MDTSSLELNFEEVNHLAFAELQIGPPELVLSREFPLNPYKDDINIESSNHTDPNYEYADEGCDLGLKPDPWCENNGLSSPLVKTGDDFDDYLALGRLWLDFLRVPYSTLLLLKALITSITYNIEVHGYHTPVDLIGSLCDAVTQNWPADYPRNFPDTTIKFPDDIDMTKVLKVYGKILKDGLQCRKQFVNLKKFLKRRDNFTNWTKLSSILDCLARELGPHTHNIINELICKIDNLVSYHSYNSRENAIWINEYKTDIRIWANHMFKIPYHLKMRGGKLVVFNVEEITVNEDELAATEAYLHVIENNNANFANQPMTMSDHELDSGINLEE